MEDTIIVLALGALGSAAAVWGFIQSRVHAFDRRFGTRPE
jgi:hypothetical protein